MFSKISTNARHAIAAGVEREDPVADLELLGFPQRHINLLEEANIMTLTQLVQYRPFQLLQLHQFGQIALDNLMNCLSRYDELDAIKSDLEREVTLIGKSPRAA